MISSLPLRIGRGVNKDARRKDLKQLFQMLIVHILVSSVSMSSTNLIHNQKFHWLYFWHTLLYFRYTFKIFNIGEWKTKQKIPPFQHVLKKVVYMVNEGKYQVGKQVSAFSKKQIFVLQYGRHPAKCSKYIREYKIIKFARENT